MAGGMVSESTGKILKHNIITSNARATVHFSYDFRGTGVVCVKRIYTTRNTQPNTIGAWEEMCVCSFSVFFFFSFVWFRWKALLISSCIYEYECSCASQSPNYSDRKLSVSVCVVCVGLRFCHYLYNTRNI